MRNVAYKSSRENQNICSVFNKFSSPPENRPVCEIMCKTVVQPYKSQTTIWRMCVAFWIPKATNTHSKCVLLLYGSYPQAIVLLRYVRKVRILLAFLCFYIVVVVCVAGRCWCAREPINAVLISDNQLISR